MNRDRNYPVIPESGDDARFTFGLTVDVAELLTRRGYPELTTADHVALSQALFRFLYRDGAR